MAACLRQVILYSQFLLQVLSPFNCLLCQRWFSCITLILLSAMYCHRPLSAPIGIVVVPCARPSVRPSISNGVIDTNMCKRDICAAFSLIWANGQAIRIPTKHTYEARLTLFLPKSMQYSSWSIRSMVCCSSTFKCMTHHAKVNDTLCREWRFRSRCR